MYTLGMGTVNQVAGNAPSSREVSGSRLGPTCPVPVLVPRYHSSLIYNEGACGRRPLMKCPRHSKGERPLLVAGMPESASSPRGSAVVQLCCPSAAPVTQQASVKLMLTFAHCTIYYWHK